MRKINIPVFVPHRGCPHTCVFCDQHIITGQEQMTPEKAEAEIRQTLKTLPEQTEREIAFFGGSFTGIGEAQMTAFLDVAQAFVERGDVKGIRLSTRPDYINDFVLDLLGRYAVRHIELGIQSTDNRVLTLSERGHDAETALNACRAVKAQGFGLVGQMMVGLPGADLSSEVKTARQICLAGADAVRIYPTLVLRGSCLHGQMLRGEYRPLTVTEAVERTASVLEIADFFGVEAIRIGLCETDGLRTDAVGGPYHPAMGELVKGEVFRRRLFEAASRADFPLVNTDITVKCPKGKVSQLVGQGQKNLTAFRKQFGVRRCRVSESNDLHGFELELLA